MATLPRDDAEILEDVLAELRWDPEVDPTDVGVEVDDGVVTLTGTVESFWKRWAAEQAVLRIKGVRAVANDIQVTPQGVHNDTDIAKDVAAALERNSFVPREQIKITVQDGWVTLEGVAGWWFVRDEAEQTVRRVPGVVGVTNLISIGSALEGGPLCSIKQSIERALFRSAEIAADRIHVQIEDGRVTLTGTVRCRSERNDAERAALRVPDVTSVVNQIMVKGE